MADLVGTSWEFVDVAGAPVGPVPERSRPEVTFDADGQVYGTGGVNRFRGTYALDDGVLRLGPLATTLMAGIPEHADREAAVHALLAGPLTVHQEPDRLELVDAAGTRTLLRPARPHVVAV